MNKYLSIVITVAALLFSNACSKQEDELHGEFSFTYNGKEYQNSPSNLDDDGFEVSNEGIRHIYFYMPDVFGGEIYFDTHNCAYLIPQGTIVTKGENCNLSSFVNGQIVPIDSSKVFTFQSGTLKLFISDCKTHSLGSGLDWSTCRASGTFDLTLANNLNETIEITNGIFNNILFFE